MTLNVAEPWTKLSIPVLAIYRSADFVTDEADHRRIVDIVNGAHPGNAKLAVIPGIDHDLVNAGSPKASRERSTKGAPAPYDERFSAAVATWLCEHERCARGIRDLTSSRSRAAYPVTRASFENADQEPDVRGEEPDPAAGPQTDPMPT